MRARASIAALTGGPDNITIFLSPAAEGGQALPVTSQAEGLCHRGITGTVLETGEGNRRETILASEKKIDMWESPQGTPLRAFVSWFYTRTRYNLKQIFLSFWHSAAMDFSQSDFFARAYKPHFIT